MRAGRTPSDPGRDVSGCPAGGLSLVQSSSASRSGGLRRVCSMLLGALLVLATGAWGQAPPVQPGTVLTLEQAVALALQHNRLVQSAALEVDKATDRVAATRSRFFPAFEVQVLESYLLTSVDFTFERGTFGAFPGTGPIPAQDTKISTPRRPTTLLVAKATQPLSQLYRIGLGVELQKLGGAVAQEKLRMQQQAVVHDVKSAYYGILQTLSGLETLEEAMKSYREMERLVTTYAAQQRALKADLLEVRTRLQKAEYEALRLRNALASQREHLNLLLGLDLLTDVQVRPVPDTPSGPADPAEASRRALERRPEVKEAQLKVQQAEYDRRMKKAEYIPDLSLAFSYLSPFGVELVPQNIATVGLLLSWEPFDWGKKKREAAEKGKTVAQAGHAARETEAAVQLEVRGKLRTLQEMAMLLQVNKLAQETATEKLRVVTQKYAQQATLLQDVLQTQAALAEANNQYQQGLLAFWKARAEFEKALGEE